MSKVQDTYITEGMRILRGFEEPKKYIPPNTILKLFKHLITDEGDRTRFMQFIAHKHKHNTHEYQISFMLTGQGCTGSSILTDTIMKYIAGLYRHYVISTTLDVDEIIKLVRTRKHKDRTVVLFMCSTELTWITDNPKDFVAQIELELPSFCKYLRDLRTIAVGDYYDDYYCSSNWNSRLKGI